MVSPLSNADGKVTSAEFKDAAPKNSPKGGPPPGGGPGGPARAKGGTTARASKSTDPADTNQDGTVSETERLAYANKQQTISATESIKTTNTTTS